MSGDETDPLRDRLRSALRTAMKAQDESAVVAFRTVLGAIDNAEAVVAPTEPGPTDGVIAGAVQGLGTTEVARAELSEAQVEAIIRKEIADRRASAASYDRAGRHTQAGQLSLQADLLATVLRDD